MPKFTDRQSLINAFKKLGEDEATSSRLADEQLTTGKPILERQSFLAVVNSFVCGLDEPESLLFVKEIPESRLKEKEFRYHKAVRNMLDRGVDPSDIKLVITEMQYELLEQLFSLLDLVSNHDDFPIDEFNLYAINETTNAPELHLDGLHESIYEMKQAKGL